MIGKNAFHLQYIIRSISQVIFKTMLQNNLNVPYRTKQCWAKATKFFEGNEIFIQESLHLQAALLDKSDEI